MKLPASLTATLLLATTLGAGLSGEVQARMYKWTDAQGNVHYGDRIPPEYAEQEQRRLNEQGVTVEVRERAKTPEELAEERRLAEIKAEEEERRRRQQIQDRILLDTFSNEDEIILTRDGKLNAIDAIVRVTEGRIESLRSRLAELTTRAANLERGGKVVPDNLHQDIHSARQQIENNQAYIAQKEREQQDIREQYEADIQRFRGLMRQREEERQKAEAAGLR